MMQIRTKLLFLIAIPFLIGAITTAVYSIVNVSDKTLEVAQEKLKSDLNMALELADERYEGVWSVVEGELYKGDTLMNGNEEFVDLVKELTTDSISLFLDDRRVATNILSEDGRRAIGTQASQEVVDTVIGRGEAYYGETDVVGVTHQTAYQPIVDAHDEVIGMFFVGVPNEPYEKAASDFGTTLALLMTVGLIIAIIGLWLFLTWMFNPLTNVTRMANKIAIGDLSVDEVSVKSKDEIGQLGKAMNHMAAQLKEVISSVKDTSYTLNRSATDLASSSTETAQAAEQVSTSIHEVANGANTQLQSTTETANVIEETAIGIQKIADATGMINEAASKMVQEATEGNEQIDKVMNQMENIDHVVYDSKETINQLEDLTKEISTILSLIIGISEQTNLLALNAAIEAARAGEYGQGFAVVAEEVRKLSEQTSQSTIQVTKLVEDIQAQSYKSVESMNLISTEVTSELALVQKSGEVFKNILESSKLVSAQTAETSSISEQMAASTEEISASVRHISEIAEETSSAIEGISHSAEEQLASTEEMNALSESLKGISEELNKLIDRFKI